MTPPETIEDILEYMRQGKPLPRPPEWHQACEEAAARIEAAKDDPVDEEELQRSWCSFILDTRLGGP